MDVYILHIIPKEFLIFFFQAADQKTKGKFTLFWGDTFYDSTEVYDDDFFFKLVVKNKKSHPAFESASYYSL